MKSVIRTAWSARWTMHEALCSGQRPLPASVWCVCGEIPRQL